MKKFKKLAESALTLKVVYVFVSAVFLTVLLLTVLSNSYFSRFAVGGVFPGYTMKAYSQTPLSNLELPDITPYIRDIEQRENTESEDDIIITHENILSFKNFDIVRKKLYNIEQTAYVYDDELDFEKLLACAPNVDLYGGEPKILIFHTHASEAFADSVHGVESDTVVGVGEELARILFEKHGISALHHKGVYDMVDGKIVRGNSYEKMETDITLVLEQNPSIEVLIDLHRDSIPSGGKLVTDIDGVKTAQIMFVNGVCRLNEDGLPVPTEGLENGYIEENLALSLSMKLYANELYPDFARKNYIKPYRYSLHLKPNTLLIEVGTDGNTVYEVRNAMEPLAELLVRAFS